MTGEYKERIIKYLTNNYNEQTPTDTPYIIEETTGITMQVNFSNYFDSIGGYIQGKDGKGNDLNIGFIYGIKNNKGMIVIIDNDYNILQVLDEYNTGTKFGQWICLNIDITNGNIYGIDEDSGHTRFLLLNNFLVKTPAQENYEVKLRNSYIIQLEQVALNKRVFIDKSPSSAFYVIIGTGTSQRLLISTYKIEVGMPNELITYQVQGTQPGLIIATYNILWSGENYTIKIADTSTRLQYKEYTLSNTDEYIQSGITFNLPHYISSSWYNYCLTNENVYALCQYNNTDDIYIYKYNYDTTNLTEIYHKELNGKQALVERLDKKNNYCFVTISYHTLDVFSTANYIMGIIDKENNFIYYESDEITVSGAAPTIVNITTNYNLLIYNLTGLSNVRVEMKQLFNENNWNYTDYQNYNAMIPNSGMLYDENNNVIFARNLYNKTINGNTTTSTLEVPNMMLNDTTIAKQNLLGKTNGLLITNTDDITKNVYEDLFINFNNKLIMQDRNTSNYINNINGATRLNNSISNTADYTNATLNKIQINYLDGTSEIQNIAPATQISQFVYQYIIYLQVSKIITNIQFLSNDTNTIYQTIDGSQLEINKVYKISQNVEIQ